LSRLRWSRLRNVVIGAAHFRHAGKKHASRRRLSISHENNLSTLETTDGTSRTSLDSGNSNTVVDSQQHQQNSNNTIDFAAFDRIRDRLGSIVKASLPQESSTGVMSSAGLLISSGEGNTPVNESMKQSNGSNSHDLSPRMLARSDSFAGDAKFIDKLQKLHIDSKMKCQKALKFNENDEMIENRKSHLVNGNHHPLQNNNNSDKLCVSMLSPTK
jgi:hypothetical protein